MDDEKQAAVFADVLEYREAFAMLQQYGTGFNIQFNRYWHGDDIFPTFMVSISKLDVEKSGSLLWSASQKDDSFLKAVRLAVRMAELEAHAYFEKMRIQREAVEAGTDVGLRRAWPTGPGLASGLAEEYLRRQLREGPSIQPLGDGSFDPGP